MSSIKAKLELEINSIRSQIPELKNKVEKYEETNCKQSKRVKKLEKEITSH